MHYCTWGRYAEWRIKYCTLLYWFVRNASKGSPSGFIIQLKLTELNVSGIRLPKFWTDWRLAECRTADQKNRITVLHTLLRTFSSIPASVPSRQLAVAAIIAAFAEYTRTVQYCTVMNFHAKRIPPYHRTMWQQHRPSYNQRVQERK